MLNRTYALEAAPSSGADPLAAWSNSRWWTSSRYTALRIRRSRVPKRGSASAASVTLTEGGAAPWLYGTWPSSCAKKFGSIRRTRSSAAVRSGRGAVCPRSHCDTDAWDTPSASASPRWDRPHSSRARWSACPNRRRCSAVATLRPLPRCLPGATSMPDHLTADRLSGDSRRKL